MKVREMIRVLETHDPDEKIVVQAGDRLLDYEVDDREMSDGEEGNQITLLILE